MTKEINIITVCGSGTISSSFIANKLISELGKEGYKVNCTEATNGELPGLTATGKYHLICYASPVPQDFGIPKISAVGLLTGIGEEDVIAKVLEVAKQIHS